MISVLLKQGILVGFSGFFFFVSLCANHQVRRDGLARPGNRAIYFQVL